MRGIQRLPESVHSSVRSGAVICDLPTIVEELILNSLEAGSTKVSVTIGVRSCYVKVVDNGYGITRDGLLLLGETHATSKVNQMTLMDTGIESIDYHGEALCSISNVSLLEIVTKVRGKPNGYKKMMKNSKCLFLGINDERLEAGTTVVVSDIFYNQPVRRKHMESSPNKVLDSIKTIVLRVAVVHVNVCFKVVDAESADELLHYGPSSSPLSLLSSTLGIEDSISFNKVDFSDGELKLTGFISDPCEKFYLKAIQYVYINSRFTCKGPIHKLVNQLAAKFDYSRLWLPATCSQEKKQNKYDSCPTFILNLCCPRSYYDMITSEQSRRMVEFKDWGPILTFVENGIMHLWARNISHSLQSHPMRAHPLEADMRGTLQSKKRSIKQNCEFSLDLSSPQPKRLHKSYDNIPTVEEYVSSIFKPSRRVPELKKHHTGPEVQSETGYLSQSFDRSLADCKITMKSDILSHISPGSVFFQENMAYAYDDKKVECPSSSALGNSLLEVDGIGYLPTSSGVSADHVKFSDEVYAVEDKSKSILWSCSFQRSSSLDMPTATDMQFEFENGNDTRIWKRFAGCDDDILDDANWRHGRDLHYDESSPAGPSSLTHYNMYKIPKFASSLPSPKPGWSPMPIEKVTGITFDGDDAAIYKMSVEDYSDFGSVSNLKDSAWMEDDVKYSNLDGLPPRKCSAMYFSPDNEREITEFHRGGSLKSLKRSSRTDWSLLPSYIEGSRNCLLQLSYEIPSLENFSGRANVRHREAIINRKKYYVRSHSAPPYYNGKKRYLGLTDSSTILSAQCHLPNIPSKSFSNEPSNSSPANTNMACLQKSFGPSHLSPVKGSLTDCSFKRRELTPETVVNEKRTQKRDQFMKLGTVDCKETVQCPDMKVSEDSFDSGSKWRNCYPSTVGGGVQEYKNQDNIIDISSDFLDHPNDSLIPKSMGRMTLEDAKVLNQVDKKFIPVVAGKNLAIIDQHAADERIRLEELRHKVLTGEMRTITYLDTGQELVLPEIGYQLLHNYAEQIQTWGWICNIHSHDTSSFAKHLYSLHREPAVVKLLTVPCILGVNLTDIDLLEYLQQLSDTDGSSTIPPAVNRVLNNKACRGAIMFGDALLLSECSLIVEELKRTSLCFQCAHGRPTTVPLVNLDILHQKIAKYGLHKVSWHGLQQHKLSLERSTRRLHSSSR